ncbi:MAG TPA: hypothetical protein VJA84_00125 [Candidatus Omnitrophota bacterium]|nr:hypothetical protein [Candidatus Omnitrophota bacterium]
MNCRHLRLISRYADNELNPGKKAFMDTHILTCFLCLHELKGILSIKEGIQKNKIGSPPEFFWQTLKEKIRKEENTCAKTEEFTFDFARWSRRLIPVPVLASLLIVILLNLNQTNLVDEYLFANQDNSVLELIENPGNQSISGWLY